jgi:hypothetical protein
VRGGRDRGAHGVGQEWHGDFTAVLIVTAHDARVEEWLETVGELGLDRCARSPVAAGVPAREDPNALPDGWDVPMP